MFLYLNDLFPPPTLASTPTPHPTLLSIIQNQYIRLQTDERINCINSFSRKTDSLHGQQHLTEWFFFLYGLVHGGLQMGRRCLEGNCDCCPVWLSGCKHHTCCWRSTWDVFLLCFKGMFGSLGDTPIHPGLLMKNKSVWLEFNLQNSEFCTIKQFKKERLYVVLCTFLVITKTCCFFSLSFFFLETFWRIFADEEWSLQQWHGSQFPLRHRC